jgi:hypothetical protein
MSEKICHPCPEGYKRLRVGQIVKEGDLANAKSNEGAYNGYPQPGQGNVHGFMLNLNVGHKLCEIDGNAYYRKIKR